MKKTISFILIVCMILSFSACGKKEEPNLDPKPVSLIDAAEAYADVYKDVWYTDSVNWAVNENIVEAAKPTEFGVNTPLTKVEVVLAMWKAAGAPGRVLSAKTVEDSHPDSDLSKALDWAKDTNLPLVHEDDTFQDTASRYDAIYYMWIEDGCLYVTDVTEFDDAKGQDAVNWAKSKGITEGVGNNLFAGDRDVTKAMMVTFLFRAK